MGGLGKLGGGPYSLWRLFLIGMDLVEDLVFLDMDKVNIYQFALLTWFMVDFGLC